MQKRFSILISAMTLAISAAAQVGAIESGVASHPLRDSIARATSTIMSRSMRNRNTRARCTRKS